MSHVLILSKQNIVRTRYLVKQTMLIMHAIRVLYKKEDLDLLLTFEMEVDRLCLSWYGRL